MIILLKTMTNDIHFKSNPFSKGIRSSQRTGVNSNFISVNQTYIKRAQTKCYINQHYNILFCYCFV